MVIIDLDIHSLQALAVSFGAGLAVEVGYDDAVDAEPLSDELVPETDDVHIVGDAQVVADLVLLDVNGADHYYDFGIVLHLKQHLELAIRLESREDTACVIVVEEFAAEFEV